jgi:hypothetical protein
MRLTNKARAELRAVLRNAERARAYIHADSTAVCRRDRAATTTLHYSRRSDGAVLYEVERAYGSDLCGLDVAIERLGSFLATH